MIKNIKWLFLVSLTLIACNDDDQVLMNPDSSDGLPLTAGTADFRKFVSVGNSLTAGFSDNALFMEGQKGSYPNILAQKFLEVGGGEFKTPLMADNIGGFNSGGVQIAQFGPRLYFNGAAPVPVPGISGTSISTVLTGGFNNMGVPGAKSFHLLSPGYGTLNPYFGRFASSAGTSIIADATAQNATFFSLWIGNNDVLSYATSGGVGVNQVSNPNPASYGSNDITSPAVFQNVYTSLVNALTASGAKGVVANIPYVTSVPYFTTVPINPIPGLPPANAAQLNQLFGGINSVLTMNGLPKRFATLVADDGNAATTENNPLLIIDEILPNLSAQITAALTPQVGAATAAFLGNLYGQARHATNISAANRDYIVLPARGSIGTIQTGAPSPFNTVGVSFPMGDGSVLTASETAEVKTATDAFNATIQSVATSKGLAFVDANSTLVQVANGGISNSGYTVTSAFLTGGGFSLDGVHPSPRGYALIANKFLQAINLKYGSNFKDVKFSDYRILYPATL